MRRSTPVADLLPPLPVSCAMQLLAKNTSPKPSARCGISYRLQICCRRNRSAAPCSYARRTPVRRLPHNTKVRTGCGSTAAETRKLRQASIHERQWSVALRVMRMSAPITDLLPPKPVSCAIRPLTKNTSPTHSALQKFAPIADRHPPKPINCSMQLREKNTSPTLSA